MKWLVSSTSGKTIELPIKSTLKEWFSTLEYFIATHGWRKGKSDTALKTAQSGYLTRRLVDASQNIIVKEDDCKTVHHKTIYRSEKGGSFQESFEDKIRSYTAALDVKNTKGDTVVPAGTLIDNDVLKVINAEKVEEVSIRSVLTCEVEGWVCKSCYGLDLGLNQEVEIGTPVGVIAAQSIWEPGTQLTMRTFHSGWVAKEGGDMTQGLARVEALFEARNPKIVAEIADISGTVEVDYVDGGTVVRITAEELVEEEYYFAEDFDPVIKVGQEIKAKQVLARHNSSKNKIVSTFPWEVKKISDGVIVVKDLEKRVFEYSLDLWRTIYVATGDKVRKGQKFTEGYLSLAKLMVIGGVLETQNYIVNEIKSIYSSQGQTVSSKHIELIVRQMFSRVRVIDKWDTEFFPGDIVDIIKFKNVNDVLIKTGKKPGIGLRSRRQWEYWQKVL